MGNERIKKNRYKRPKGERRKWWRRGLALSAKFILGVVLLLAKPKDYRSEYAMVFEEQDRRTREALAAATLKDLADVSRRQRIITGATNVGVPIVATITAIVLNVANGRAWYEDLGPVSAGQTYGLIQGFTMLFQKSEDLFLE